MSNKLASLAIELSANITKFESDMGRAARIAKRDSERMKKQVSAAMKAIGASAITAGAGLAVLVKSTANTADAIQKMSDRLGVSTEFLSQYRHVAELSGTSLDRVGDGIRKMSKSVNDANNGLSTATRAFESLGISLDHLNSLSPEQQFELIADRMSQVESQSVKAGAAMDIFGRAGVDLLTVLNQGSEGIANMRDEADAFGGTISQNAANAAAHFNDELTRLSNQFKFMGEDIARDLMPEVTALITEFRKSDFVKHFAENVKNLIKTIGGLVDEAVLLVKVFGSLYIVNKLSSIFKLYGGVVLGLSGAFSMSSKAIAGYTLQLGIMKKAMLATTGIARGLLAVIGGPVGLALFGGYAAWKGISAEIEARAERISELSKVSDEAAAAMQRFHAAASGSQEEVQSLKSIASELDTVNAKLKELRKQQGENFAGSEFGYGSVKGGQAIQETQDQIDALEKQKQVLESMANIAPKLKPVWEAIGAFGEAWEAGTEKANAFKMAYDGQIESVNKWIEGSEKTLEKLKEENEQYGLSAVAVVELQAEKMKLIATGELQRAEIDKVTKALIEQIKIQEKNVKATQALDKARALIKGLSNEFKPLSEKFKELAENMATIENAKISPEFSEAEYQEGFELIQEQAEAMAKEIVDNVKEIYDEIPQLFGESAKEIEQIDFTGMFDNFAAGLNPAIGALQSFRDEIGLIDDLTKSGQFTAGQEAFYKTGLTAEFALNSMASMAEEGSSAQKKLQAAAAITNTILGITAILEQGKGDPYTAFGRMAAMAALVASLGVQVTGAFGGSGGGGAQRQQASQGTGTVLGDTAAKSESMANALDLIADASEKIVGINSRMLRSLNTMASAISGTVTQIAKGGNIGDLGTEAGGFGGLSEIFGGTGITSFFDNLIFGSSKVIDQGIEILSGGISEAIDGTLVGAYEVARRKGLFGSSTRTGTGDLADGISNQISLIFQSMSDAVLAGAESLGLNMADIQAALDSYQIEAQKISLMDLDADEQQAQLEAVFSSIFDGLVSYSIPFITQFQQAGEGLGETLARVSTTVLVFEEAIDSMGLDFIAKQVNPELFAQAAVAIADFAGGMEEFIDGYTTYVSKFLSEAEQMEILTNRLTGVFSDIGLDLPDTREEFTQLIQSLDLTTAAGQEAFGTLIALSGQMDSFYSGLEEAQQEALQAEQQIAETRAQLASMMAGVSSDIEDLDLSPFAARLKDIKNAFNEQIKTAKELGASERELAMIQTYASRQIQQAIQMLENDIRTALTDLYGTELDQVNEQIALLEQQGSMISDIGEANQNRYEDELRAIQNIQGYLDSLLLDEALSTLNPMQQLAEAQAQFDEMLALAKGGDIDAQNALPGLSNTLLSFGRDVWASGEQYTDLFNMVTGALAGVGVTRTPSDDSNSIMISQNSELIALQQRANELQEQQAANQDFDAAWAIAEQIGRLSSVTNESFADLAERLGLPVEQFLGDLGVSLDTVTVETTMALAELASTMGVNITELADSVGLSLGSLVDDQSLLNEALEGVISSLPKGIANDLDAMLTAIEKSTNPAAREAILSDMEEYIASLPADQANLLAPFFENIDPTTNASQQLDRMTELNETNNAIKSEVESLRQEQVNSNSEVDSKLDKTNQWLESNYYLMKNLVDIMGVA